jgi:hypothetical protein
MAGWSAHRMEEVLTGNRIIRPAYKAIAKEHEYIKIAEILDIDEEGPNGKNEAGYKRLYFETYVRDNNENIVQAGGIPMDAWPSAEYNIRVHNMHPLEIIVDWVDTEEGFRDIIILRDDNDEMTY